MLILGGGVAAMRGITGYCPFYDMMGKEESRMHNINIRTSLIVKKPVEEVYAFWRKLSNLPLFMEHLQNVEETGKTSSIWMAKIPGGLGTISWNAVIVNERRNEVLGWRSLSNSAIDNAGKVKFTKMDSYTTGIEVVFSYKAPFGLLGENIARLFTPSFEKLITKDIQRFSGYIENGFLKNEESDFRNELI